MRKLVHLITLLSPLALMAQTGLRTNVTLHWEYDPVELTNASFYIRGTETLVGTNQWWTNWPIVHVLPGTTNTATATNITLAILPGKRFYINQASNFWGIADPSNVASTPAPPRSDFSLGVR